MSTIYWISPILNILAFLGIITGLWMAGRILPTFITWINSEDLQAKLSRPFPKIILWLALGTFFTLPLIDFVVWLGNFFNFALAPQLGDGFTTMLGTVPTRVYSIFPILVMVAVYGITFWLTMGYLLTPGQFNQTERIFIVLAIASLAYRAVDTLFTLVFSFQIPLMNVQQDYGVPGYLIEVLIGIALLTLILLGLNKYLPGHPISE